MLLDSSNLIKRIESSTASLSMPPTSRLNLIKRIESTCEVVVFDARDDDLNLIKRIESKTVRHVIPYVATIESHKEN